MKRFFKVGLIAVIAILFLGSCAAVLNVIIKDKLAVASGEYSIDKMYVLNYGQYGTDNFYLDVWLVTDGIIVDGNGNFTGSGVAVGFYLISETPTLSDGPFSYTGDFNGGPNTMYSGSPVYINVDYDPFTVENEYEINGGQLDVAISTFGDLYNMEFQGTTTSGSAISATFRGPIEGSVINVP